MSQTAGSVIRSMAMTCATPPSASVPETPDHGRARLLRGLALGGGGLLAALLLGAAGLLWVRNGTSVFFETLSAGLAACF